MERVRAKARSNPEALSGALQAADCKLGLSDFQTEQKQAIESALCGKDVFVMLPTGFGKSAIYQALPYCAESLDSSHGARPMVLVISLVGCTAVRVHVG